MIPARDTQILVGSDRTDALAPIVQRALTVVFDVSNKCNLRCRMCYFSYDSVFHRRAVHMRPETFERIAEHLLPLAHTVYLSAGSESLTSPHFAEILAIAGRHDVPEKKLLSNALLLTPELDDALIASGLTQLHVSIDGATRATYEHVRRGGDFEVLCANLRRLRRRKAELAADEPLVQFNVTLMRANLDELETFVDLAREVGAEQIACRHLMPYEGLDMERELTNGDPRAANERFAAFLDRAARARIRVTSFPDFYAVDGREWEPVAVATPRTDPCVALERDVDGDADPRISKPVPFGCVDSPATATADAEGSIELTGWALAASGLARVEVRRVAEPGEAADADGTLLVGTASRRNGSRPDVAFRYPSVAESWRAGWTFELARSALPSSQDARADVRVVAVARAGSRTEIGRREVRFRSAGLAAPYIYCRKPFDNVYVDAAANVYPYPDCQTVDPFGSLSGDARFQDVWFGAEFRELRRRIVDRDPPPMCTTCPDFINRRVDDPAFFAVRAVERDFRLPTGFVDAPVDGTITTEDEVLVRGWALGFAPIERVEILRESDPRDPPDRVRPDGLVLVATAAPGSLARPDVAARHRHYSDHERAGWSTVVDRAMLDGRFDARLVVRARNVEGGEVEIGRARVRFTVDGSAPRRVAGAPFGAVDRPGEGHVVRGPFVDLVGWALPGDGAVARVFVRRAAFAGELGAVAGFVDIATAVPHAKRRPDVLARHPDVAPHDRCGWIARIAREKLGPDATEVSVLAEDSRGRVAWIGSRTLLARPVPIALEPVDAPAAPTADAVRDLPPRAATPAVDAVPTWIPAWVHRP